MLYITRKITISLDEIEVHAIRAQGPGGQNVNKVSTAIHLRFDINASSLPDRVKERLLNLSDRRVTREGIVVIKARQHRSQEKNRRDALERLRDLIRSAIVVTKKRKATRPTHSSQVKRIQRKINRGRLKALRGKVRPE